MHVFIYWREEMSVDMSAVTEEKFLKVLSKIGFQSSKLSWKWLIDYKPTEEFVKWMCENVNSSNYLSDEELIEYKKLEDSGQVLEDEELEAAISEKIPEYFELPDIGEVYISGLKDELHYLQNYSHSLEGWVEKQENEVLAAQQELSELESKTANQQNKLVSAQSECLGKSSSLETSMQNLNSHLVYLKNYCLDSGQVANSKFLSEFPLCNYIEESSAFSHELDLNMEQIISSADIKKTCDIPSRESFDVKLKKLKEGLQDTLLLLVEERAKRKGLESACKYVKGLLSSRKLWEFSSNHQSVIENLAEQKQNLQRLEARANYIGPVEFRIQGSIAQHWRDLWEVITNHVSKLCMSLEDLQKELQFHQKQAVFDKLRKLEEALKSQCATDMVWLFLLGEEVTEIMNLFELAKSGEEFLIREQQNRLLRIESMQHLKERRNCEISKAENWCLIQALLSYFKASREIIYKSDHPSVNSMLSPSEDIFYSMKILVEHIEKCEADNMKLELSVKEMLNGMITALKRRCKEFSEMKSLICSGSTENHPVFWSVNQLKFYFHPDPVSKKLKKRFGKLVATYNSEKQKSSSAQEVTARNLWKKFITNPEEMKMLINNVNMPMILLNDEMLF